MQNLDWLMGSVAIALGLVLVVTAASGARWLMHLRRPQWLVETIGPGPTRALLLVIGLVCVALGIVILSGWRPPWQ